MDLDTMEVSPGRPGRAVMQGPAEIQLLEGLLEGACLHAREDSMQLWQLVEVALVPVSLKILVHVHPRLALQPGMTSCQGSGGLSFRAHRLDTCYSAQPLGEWVVHVCHTILSGRIDRD